jgi:hypothetical protein
MDLHRRDLLSGLAAIGAGLLVSGSPKLAEAQDQNRSWTFPKEEEERGIANGVRRPNLLHYKRALSSNENVEKFEDPHIALFPTTDYSKPVIAMLNYLPDQRLAKMCRHVVTHGIERHVIEWGHNNPTTDNHFKKRRGPGSKRDSPPNHWGVSMWRWFGQTPNGYEVRATLEIHAEDKTYRVAPDTCMLEFQLKKRKRPFPQQPKIQTEIGFVGEMDDHGQDRMIPLTYSIQDMDDLFRTYEDRDLETGETTFGVINGYQAAKEIADILEGRRYIVKGKLY